MRAVASIPPVVSGSPPDPRNVGRKSFWSSWTVGTLAGIPLNVHPTFALLLAWVALSHLLQGHGIAAVTSGLLLVLSIFACVVLHELSHALVARQFGIRTRNITLLPIGGVARLERMPEKPSQELWVALAGPAMSYAIAGVLFGILSLLGGPLGVAGLAVVGGPFLTKLLWINVGLATFNLLPAFPMDGGRVLRAALAVRLGRARATELAARVGQGMAIVFGVLGLFFNPFLLLIAVFVWLGAKSEASLVELKATLSGLPVMQAMVTNFRVLAPSDPLSRAVELAVAGFQHDFPVMDGSRLVGLLTHAGVLKGLAERGVRLSVDVVMERRFETVHPLEMLDVAFERLESSGCRVLLVVSDGEVVGLLTPESIGEALVLEKARRGSRAEPR
jgi:Zn-dependent protease/CBS domain-containing protein